MGWPGTRQHIPSGNGIWRRSTWSSWSAIVTHVSKMAEDSSVIHGRKAIFTGSILKNLKVSAVAKEKQSMECTASSGHRS